MAIISEAIKLLGRTGKETLKQQFFYGLIEKRVLVTGANGQLGKELKEISQQVNMPFKFYFTDMDSLDITDRDQVDEFVSVNKIEYIINCAAYTAVDKAESDSDKAFAVNVNGIENIAIASRKYNIKVIHISTDFVFDGESRIPYKENDSVNPLSVYGESKLEGERVLQSMSPEWIIIRTSWLYSTYGDNFAGGVMILLSKPFKGGDYITTQNLEGTVESIGILHTILRTGDNKTVYIPNGPLSTGNIINNRSMDGTLRTVIVINVDYGSNIDEVKSLLKDIAGSHPKVLKQPSPFARMTKINPTSLEFTVRVWAKSSDLWEVNHDLTELFYKKLYDKGMISSLQQVTVHMANTQS
jgi:nucleoside-diphosphate-sugar epimerase